MLLYYCCCLASRRPLRIDVFLTYTVAFRLVSCRFGFLCRLGEEEDETTFKKVVAIFVSSFKAHFKEIEEASAELKQQAVTGVIGIEASKDCWEKICRDCAPKLMPTSRGENEDKSFFWNGKVKTAEKYVQLSFASPSRMLISTF
jgi:hypothetical protein